MVDYLQELKSNAKMIGLTDEQSNVAIDAYNKNPKLAQKFRRKGVGYVGLFKPCYEHLEKKISGAYALAVSLLLVSHAKQLYAQKNIPDKIFWDTMSDIKIWANNYGVTKGVAGVGELGWLKNHFKLNLFRLGRLQFQFSKILHPKLITATNSNINDKAIFVHIPQGEALDIDMAKQSFANANEFFAKYYPKYGYKIYFTDTWLLYSGNKNFMSENCNIIKFANLFEFVCDRNQPKEATDRIFGAEYQKSQAETSMQKACRQYMEQGGKVGVGIGYIHKNKQL